MKLIKMALVAVLMVGSASMAADKSDAGSCEGKKGVALRKCELQHTTSKPVTKSYDYNKEKGKIKAQRDQTEAGAEESHKAVKANADKRSRDSRNEPD